MGSSALGLGLGFAPAWPPASVARLALPGADRVPPDGPRAEGCERADAARGGRAAGDAVYGDIVGVRFAGRETDVAADLARPPRQHGHEQVEFTVVGSANGANPHHEAGDRVIEPGDAVVLDFGGLDVRLRLRYHPHGLGRPAPAEVREVHEVVRRAQQAAVETVRPGVTCQDVDREAEEGDYGGGIRRAVHPPHRPRYRGHHTEPPYIVEGED